MIQEDYKIDSSNEFQKRYEEYPEIQQDIKQGKIKGIPITDMCPKLGTHMPGIIKGKMYMVTAASGWGKTQFTKSLFVSAVIDWVDDHPGADVDLRILYFALEEPYEDFIDSMVVHYLQKKYHVYIPLKKLKGYVKDLLTTEEYALVQMSKQEIYDKYMSRIKFIDNEYDPDRMYMLAKKFLEQLSSPEYGEEITEYTDEEGIKRINKKTVVKKVNYTNPRTHVLLITDHLNLLNGDAQLKSLMEKWSSHYCKSIFSKEWDWSVVNVVQQAMLSSEKAYDYRNQLNVDKTLPTMDGLGDSKIIGRDHHVIFGLYNPNHYTGIGLYRSYDINVTKDEGLYNYFRSVFLLKNRLGDGPYEECFFFNGNACAFYPVSDSYNATSFIVYRNSMERYKDIISGKYACDPNAINVFNKKMNNGY